MVWIAVGAAPARAASPGLGAITPWGGQRGTELEVTFSGARLGDAQEVLIYSPGITVAGLTPEGDGAFKARLQIAADCRLGAHAMRVRTATGISNLRTFSVGALAELSEAEPNNDFAQPQPIGLDRCVSGVVENEDVDYFVVEAKQGERITAEIEGIRLGNTFFDPYVAILDEARFELAASDDSALVWQDGIAQIIAPADGKYIVQVRDSSYGGSGACTYRVHIGRFPRPTALLPAGGPLGQTVEVRWLGDLLGERTETVTLPAEPDPNFGLFAQDQFGISPSANPFRLSTLENALEAEPNSELATATPFAAPRAIHGVIGEPRDRDWYRFSASKGQVFELRVLARAIRSPLDPVLTIHRASDGAGLAGADDSGGPDSYVRFTIPEDGEYALQVHDHLQAGGPDYAYRLEISPVLPALSLGLPERQQFVDMTAAVPRGNRTCLLVSAARSDFGGELGVELVGLPAGLTAETIAMPANQTMVPVVLSATADAPLAGSLVDVLGRTTDPNLPLEGHLLQTTSMVRGENNVHVWDVLTSRMATAVIDEAPVTLEIVQPKVPLLHSGNMDLKVVAHRKEGFTAAIPIRMLYNPGGVGSSGSAAIAEGANEGVIPINADGSAEARIWKIAVYGEVPVAGGTVTVSTQLADLEIAPPLFTLGFQAAAVEKGQETDVVVTVQKNRDFVGPVRMELLGLPHEVTTEPLEFAPDATEVVFRVKTTANSPVGKHPTLLCRAVVMAEGEPIVYVQGSGELRIDEPLPPKPMETAAAAPPPAAEPAPAPEKRLTHLEKLRLERRQRKEAEARAAEAAAKTEPASEASAAGDGDS